jgi:hypothetical protein
MGLRTAERVNTERTLVLNQLFLAPAESSAQVLPIAGLPLSTHTRLIINIAFLYTLQIPSLTESV